MKIPAPSVVGNLLPVTPTPRRRVKWNLSENRPARAPKWGGSLGKSRPKDGDHRLASLEFRNGEERRAQLGNELS